MVTLSGYVAAGTLDTAASQGPPKNTVSQARDVPSSSTETAANNALVDEKLQYLDSAFDDMRPGGIAWVVTWAVIYQGLFAYQLSDAIRGTENWMSSRPSNIVGAVEAELSFILTVALPFRPMTARRQFRKKSATSADEKKEKLAFGEALLRQANDDVVFVHSWLSHILNYSVSIIGGAIIWGVEGKDGWKHALISVGAGMVVATANIWSTPIKATRHYEEYQQKFGTVPESVRLRRSLGVKLVALPSPNGFSFALIF